MTHTSTHYAARRASTSARCIVLALIAIALLPGCVRRRMTIRSNPPGAMVYFDKVPIGTTPVSTPYTYYAQFREIEIAKGGFKTQKVKHKLQPPWYQYPPFDFITENLIPWEIRDERVIDFQMEPVEPVSKQDLLDRGEGLRVSSKTGRITPLVNAPTGQNSQYVLPGMTGGVNGRPSNLPRGGVSIQPNGQPIQFQPAPVQLDPANASSTQPYLTNPGP